MFKLLVLFVHLVATCTAIGAILATDLKLLGRVLRRDFRVAPPNRFVAGLVGGSLLVLASSGAVLVMLALQDDPNALANPKLQVKVGLVALLALNAFALHRWTFPRLASGRRIDPWRARVSVGVALPVAMSNALWLYVAFLGIARPWNFTLPALPLLSIAAVLVLATWVGVMTLLHVAAWRQAQRRAAAPTAKSRELPLAQAAAEAERAIARARAVRPSRTTARS